MEGAPSFSEGRLSAKYYYEKRKNMNEKNLRISAFIMTVAMLVIGLAEKVFLSLSINSAIGSVINPLLFIATLVCMYLSFKNDVSYESKWIWVVIAVHFTMALGAVANVVLSALINLDGLQHILISIIYAAGVIMVLTAILLRNLIQLLPKGFAVCAFHSLICFFVYRSLDYLISCVIYTLFILLALNKLPDFNKILRTLIVILSAILIIFDHNYAGIGLVVLAFIIVPANRPHITVSKIAAFLCIITSAAGVLAYFSLSPAEEVKHMNEALSWTYDTLAEQEKYLVECNTKLSQYNSKLADYENLLNSEKEKLNTTETQLTKAEKDLDRKCSRSYYSYLYCDSSCRSLHNTVEDLENELTYCKNKISDYEWEINSIKSSIENTKNSIDETESFINELESKLPEMQANKLLAFISVAVKFISLVLSVAGLMLLTVCLVKAEYGNKAVIACALLASGSLLAILKYTESYAYWSFDIFNFPLLRFIINPYFISIAVVAILAFLITKTEGKKETLRLFAIVASFFIAFNALIIAAVIPLKANIIGLAVQMLYSSALIFTAFAIVPVKFTEYNSIAKHIFFSIITFGIWQLIWIFNVTKNLCNVPSAEKRKPWAALLLCIFLPFYLVYWLYKTAEAVEAYGNENGKQFKIGTRCLVLAFFCPLFSTVIIQDKINQIVGEPE